MSTLRTGEAKGSQEFELTPDDTTVLDLMMPVIRTVTPTLLRDGTVFGAIGNRLATENRRVR